MLNKKKCKVEIKKVLAKTLFSLGALASIVAFQTKKQVDYSKASFEPFVIEKKNANGSYANYVDDFDISGDLPVTYLTSMAGSTNETFGTVSFVCNSYGVSRRVKYINLIGSKVRNRLTRLITIGFSKLISSSITLACQSTKSNPTNSNRIHPILLPCQRSIRRLKRLNIWYRVPIPFQILCLTQLA